MPQSQFTDEYKEFCALLIKERKDAGMTQKQVADALKKPQSYVSKYEKGERRLDVIEMLSIAKVIGFDAENLIKKLKLYS